MQSPFARDVATLSRFALYKKSMPRGASSGVDVVSDTITTAPPALGTCRQCYAHARQALGERRDLRVVRRDHHQIATLERRLFSLRVAPTYSAAHELRDQRFDRGHFLRGAPLIAVVLDRHVHEPRAAELRGERARGREHRLILGPAPTRGRFS
jgi:hypothetical protein